MEVSWTKGVNKGGEILKNNEEDRDGFLTLKVWFDATISISLKSNSITIPIYFESRCAIIITWKHKGKESRKDTNFHGDDDDDVKVLLAAGNKELNHDEAFKPLGNGMNENKGGNSMVDVKNNDGNTEDKGDKKI